MRSSVSQKFLLGLGLTSIAFTTLTSLAAFGVFQRELEQRQIQFLSHYVEERTDNVDRRFSNLITLQRSAIDALTARMATITPKETQTAINRQFPLQADGTRRSRDKDYTGYVDADGGRVYGMGAFIGAPKDLKPVDKAALAAAFPIVARFGQAEHGDYDNLYFFEPRMRLIMFGPDRPDHLKFYRHDAPADLSIEDQEMSRFVKPLADPLGETRCTSLQHLVQDTKGAQRVATPPA